MSRARTLGAVAGLGVLAFVSCDSEPGPPDLSSAVRVTLPTDSIQVTAESQPPTKTGPLFTTVPVIVNRNGYTDLLAVAVSKLDPELTGPQVSVTGPWLSNSQDTVGTVFIAAPYNTPPKKYRMRLYAVLTDNRESASDTLTIDVHAPALARSGSNNRNNH